MFGVEIKYVCSVFLTIVDKIKYGSTKQDLSSENGA